jgi:regulator of protease activity HflC (stomatin/prohibitin superfamily)
MSITFLPFIIFAGFILFSTFKILNEYERGVILRLGKFSGIRGPGLIILIPGLEKMIKVDLRLVTMDIPSQDIISKDNVTLKVNGVVYFKVSNPERAIISVENYYHATAQIAQTTLRSVVGQYELDEILAHRDEINAKLQSILDELTGPWGIKITNVEVKAIDLPVEMQRAMAKQAEAEREKRAKIISAEGEFAAAQKISEAARVLSSEKDAITLRFLDTMREIAGTNNSSTTFFPVPVDFLSKILNR